jgi:Tfx family DNA-binding protein
VAERSKTGSLTGAQLDVLRLRMEGLTQEQISVRLGTTRQNVSLIERRAHRNIKLAEETIRAYRRLRTVATVTLPPMTHLVDVPRMIIDAADSVGVKLTVDFSLMYKELSRDAGDNISGTRVTKPVYINILKDGNVLIDSSEPMTLSNDNQS